MFEVGDPGSSSFTLEPLLVVRVSSSCLWACLLAFEMCCRPSSSFLLPNGLLRTGVGTLEKSVNGQMRQKSLSQLGSGVCYTVFLNEVGG